MADFSKRIAGLSPEKRALLIKRLQNKLKDNNKEQSISKRENQVEFPMSFAQERMWFLNQFNPNSPLYNIAAAINISGALNEKALEKSLNKIIQRHENLRATFAVKENQPVQHVQTELKLALPIVDLQNLSKSDQIIVYQQLAKEIGRQPFDLIHGPLLRAKLVRLEKKQHILLLNMHHIVYDGWSTRIFIRELSRFYDAFTNGKKPELPELPIQYTDFAAWQRQWLQGKNLESQLNYWQKQLAGVPPLLELPTDRTRPGILRYHGAHYSFKLSKKLTESIIKLSRQEEVTLFMTLLAAFQTLLYRFTTQSDICVGTPIANRNHAEIEDLIGFFVNTLVMRTNFSSDPTFCELLKQVRDVTLEGYAHQDVPFEMLVEALKLERNMSHTPIFQVMFDLQNASLEALEFSGLKLTVQEIETETAKFDLLLTMKEEVDGLSGSFEYNTDLFNRSTIERLISHFQTLLKNIIANPDRRISDLQILPKIEEHKILIEWNQTTTDGLEELCYHQLFENQVEKTPTATAVVFQKDALSYEELNIRANQLANYLQKLDFTLETKVGICVDRSLAMIVGILGILKAGGAYVPLDPTYPKERLTFILEDANISTLLTQHDLINHFPDYKGKILCLDSEWELISRENSANPANQILPENLAYIIYTSGSTGQPKGVMIQHRSVINLLKGLDKAIYDQYADTHFNVSLNAPLLFDASVQQLVMLLKGHSLFILPQEIRGDGKALVNYLSSKDIDVLDCVPSQLKILIASGLLDVSNGQPKIVLPGGEAIDEATWQILTQSDKIDFYNMYGPTECTVDSTTCAIKKTFPKPNIGHPLANATIYILDHKYNPVPIGVPGELYIGGSSLARGYLNRPQLTAEKFVPNPLSKEQGTRLYKTGDLARYLPDGNIEFLGRLDHQVKVRGFRIELGEIESVLREHQEIKEVAVLTREDGMSETSLVAYLIPHQQPGPSSSELRQFLKTKLPDYMVPSFFIALEKFPLTPNGKIDRRALPAPDRSRPDLERPFQPPQTDLELFLAKFWKEILAIEQIGIYDNFFELGGDSLKAAVLTNRLQQELGEFINVGDIFIAPAIDEFSKYLQQNYKNSLPEIFKSEVTPTAEIKQQELYLTQKKLNEIKRIPRDGELMLSFAQQRLWFIDQLEPDTPLYNISAAVRLKGSLNIIALEKTINEIICRHEILRTTFSTIEGRAIQIIAPNLSIPLTKTNLGQLPLNERETEAQRLANEEASQPFNLSKGPLIRMTLLRLTDEEFIFIVTMHHIISDGWSMEVFIREVVDIYGAFLIGKPSPLPELSIQYADFASWQRQWLQGEGLESQLAYWKQQLGNSPPILELPTDYPGPAVQSFKGSRQFFKLSSELSKSLKELSQREGMTLFMTLLAAFKTLLFRYSNQEDICVGIPIANRTRAEIESLIGFFVNTLVLRTDLSGNPNFIELLRRVNKTAIEAYAHSEIPFEMLVDELQPSRNLSTSPLFQVMFVLQDDVMHSFELPGLTMEFYDADSGTAKFDLTLVMTEEKEALSGFFEYNTDLFNVSTIERMIGHFQRLLESIILNPYQNGSTIILLGEPEKNQLLIEWNKTDVKFPQDKCAHQIFEDRAAEMPEAIAVSMNGVELNYLELNRKANRLAHYLQQLGVAPETLVAICVERSIDMIVGIVAILKAGGAYVPIDPAYPSERIAFMVHDTRSPVILTQTALNNKLSQLAVNIILLDQESSIIEQQSDSNPVAKITPKNLAYAIYTSGSTGLPKGVLIDHEGLLGLIFWHQKEFRVTPVDRATQLAGQGFDASVWEIWPYLTKGASIHIPDEETRALPTLMRDWLVKNEITITFLPTPMTESVLSLDWQENINLKILLTGGDKLHHYPGHGLPYKLVNNYGPTEVTVVSTSGIVPPKKQIQTAPSIGRPIDNTEIYILNSNLQPVPIGVTGEIYIGGKRLARGYLNRHELTAEMFIPNPFNNEPGSRMYRTRDLARYLPNGEIEFLGRLDYQVKIRGFRIELGEIEFSLEQHPDVKQAVVIVREDEPGVKRLVGYIVPDTMPGPNQTELKNFLKEKLPEYMIPAVFMTLEAMPLTPNAKIDRKALPKPEITRSELEGAVVAPRNEVEEKLAAIWLQLLGIDQVGVNDNFFELGGDSILTIQVIAKARQAGLQITPKQLFQFPTIARLAEVAGTITTIQAEQGLVIGEVPLTPIQHWFFENEYLEINHWNQSILLEISQPMDISQLREAVGLLLSHHDALRLRFQPTDSGWQQMIAEQEKTLPFMFFDLSDLSFSQYKAEIERLADEIQSSLNISKGPIARFAYFDLGKENAARLLIAIHHLAIDGISWRILLEDLYSIYHQLASGQKIQLPLKTTSFKQWSERLSEYAQSSELEQEFDYWDKITNKKFVSLPIDYPHGSNTEQDADYVQVVLDEEKTKALLQDVPSVYGTEINDVLLTAAMIAFSQWTGERSLLIDLEGHGRGDIFEDIDISRTVGWFTSLYPVFLDLGLNYRVDDCIKTIKEQLHRIPNRGFSYGILRYLSNNEAIRSKLKSKPNVEISFNYLGQFDQIDAADSLFKAAQESKGVERNLRTPRNHLISISGSVMGGRLQMIWNYSRKLHNHRTIEKLAKNFVISLHEIIEHCRSAEAGGYTPSDFNDIELDQNEIDELLEELAEV